MKRVNQLFAIILCVVLFLSIFPSQVFAKELSSQERMQTLDEAQWEEMWDQYWAEHPEEWETLETPDTAIRSTTRGTDTSLSAMRSRAEALVNYQWTPSRNISTWNSNSYNGKTYFPSGTVITGVPYTLFTSEVVAQSLCSLEQYKAVASSNYSATAYCNSVGATRTGPVYGSCCADLVSEVFGGNFMSGSSPRYHSVGSIWNTSYGTTVHSQKMSDIRAGDALSDYPNHYHIVWVGDVTDTTITIYEQTPPIARKLTLNKASFTNSSGFFVYGGKTYSTITRTKEFNVTVPEKPELSIDKTSYSSGDSITIKWNAVSGNEYYWINVYKDGTIIVDQSMGMTTSYTLSNASAGSYLVYVSANNSAGTSGSSSCSFSVVNRSSAIDGWFSTDKMGTKSNYVLINTPVYLCYKLFDKNTGDLYSTYSSNGYTVKEAIYDPSGQLLGDYTYSDSDNNWISFTPSQNGIYTGKVTFTRGTNETTITRTIPVTRDIDSDAWMSSSAMGTETTRFSLGNTCYLNYKIYDPDTGALFNTYNVVLDSYTSVLKIYDPSGQVTTKTFSSKDTGYLSYTPKTAGTYTYEFSAITENSIQKTGSFTVGYDSEIQIIDPEKPLGADFQHIAYLMADTELWYDFVPVGQVPNTYHFTVTTGNSCITARCGLNYINSAGEEVYYLWITGKTEGATYAKLQMVEDDSGNSVVVASNTFYFYTSDSLKVYYDANGGSLSVGKKMVTYNSPYGELPVPTKDGFRFDGWIAIDPSNSTNKYKVDENSTVQLKASHYLVASWKPENYEIVYNANGGEGTPIAQEKAPGESIAITSQIPTRFGYNFAGWAKSASATTATYKPGDIYALDEDVVLYAVWSRLTISTTTYTTKAASVAYPGSGIYFAFTPTVSTNYCFSGTEESLDTKVQLFDSNGGLLASDDDSGAGRNFRLCYALTSGKTYYYYIQFYSSTATGVIQTMLERGFSVTYNANGGTGAPDKEYRFTNSLYCISADIPTRSGYSFTYWNTASNGSGQIYEPLNAYTGNADLTLYAIWAAENLSGNCGVDGNNLTWTLNRQTGVLSITGTGAMMNYSASSSGEKAPWASYADSIKTVRIAEGATSVGNYAFYGCTELASVTLPSSTTRIGASSFRNCSAIKSITIPNAVKEIGSYAFNSCSSLQSISIPDGVTVINMSFGNCSSLTSVTIGSSVQSIYAGAFENCTSLQSIVLPANVKNVYNNAFGGCTSLTKMVVMNANCYFYPAETVLGVKGKTTIYGYKDSSAETYANEYGFTFKVLCDLNGHSYVNEVTAPTCTAQGYTTHTCSVCGNSYKDSYTTALGHNYGYAVTTAPTTSAAGVLTGTCSRCSTKTTVTLPKLDTTNYTYSVVKAASCTATGTGRYTWKTTTYGTFYFDVTIAKTAHNYVGGVCTNCGAKDPNYVQTDAKFVLSESRGAPGTTVTVEISIEKNPGIVSAYLDLNYDTTKLTLTNVEDTGLLKGALFGNDYTAVPFALNWDDSLSAANNTSNGIIAKLTFQIKENCPEGSIPITLSFDDGNIIDKDLNNVVFQTVAGTMEVVKYVPGDVDGDGSVLAKDVAALRRYLAHWTGTTIVEAAADVNRDGSVTAGDVAILRRYLAHWTGVTLSAVPAPQTATRGIPHRGANDPTIAISSIEGNVGDQVTLNVDLLNNPGIVSAYLDLSYDNSKLKLVSVEDTKLLNGALFSNDYTVIPFALNWDDSIASANNTKNGTIAKLTFEILDGCKDGPATVSISYADGNILDFGLNNVDFAVENGTVSAQTHVHHYTAVVTAPTCTEQGYTTYTCTCGDSYVGDYVPALGHNYELTGWNWTGYTAATATFTCKNDASHVQTLKATITSTRTEPTCTASGKVVYTAKVTFESKSYSDTKTETLNALGHNWNAPIYTWSSDYSKVTASRSCKNDASHVEEETVNTTSKVTKTATCTEKGETTYTATFSNSAFAVQTKTIANINATGHTASTPVKENEVAATCETNGSYDEVVYCSVCGAELSREVKTMDAIGHEWNAPTYTWSEDYSEVTAKRTCNRDESHTEVETVKTTSEVTKPATTEEKGETTYTAVFTNPAFMTQTKTVANLDIVGLEWSDPTYEWSGDYSKVTATRVCTNKEGLIETETVDTTSEVTKSATCTERGETTYSAEFENAAFTKQTKTVENLEALGHDYQASVTAPTCTEKGYTTYTCARCDDSYVADEIDALGHTPGDPVKENEVEATCLEAGGYDLVVYCTVCKEEISRIHTRIEALGHDWSEPTYTWYDDNSEVTASRLCKNDESHFETETVKTTSVTQAATADEDGKTVYMAVFENAAFETQTKTINIPKLDPADPCAEGHDWDTPDYAWSEDNSQVTAIRVCNTNPEHVEAETVLTSSQVTKEATYDEEGEITYTATFTNPAFETQVKAVATPKLEKPPVENPFVDVKDGDWFKDAVLWAVSQDPAITNGTDEIHFSPNKTCTRAEVVQFLYNATGKPKMESADNPFKDVKENDWYYNAVMWAVSNKITDGTSRNTFSPKKTCTRAEVVQFLRNSVGKPSPIGKNNPFTDVKSRDWFYESVLWAVEEGLTSGTTPTTFAPTKTCTRAEVVQFLYKAKDYSENMARYHAESYEIVLESCTWAEAQAAAKAKGGKLVTFDDRYELVFVLQLIATNGEKNALYHIGGGRKEESESYQWLDQDGNLYGDVLNDPSTWCYSMWQKDEPDIIYNDIIQTAMTMFYSNKEKRWCWYDIGVNEVENTSRSYAYIIEYPG